MTAQTPDEPLSGNPIILVIDDQGGLIEHVEAVVDEQRADLVSVTDVGLAKRRMLKDRPTLIISQTTFASDPGAGLRLCRDLHDHGGFRDIPVVLSLRALSPDAERFAKEAGAKALLAEPWDPQKIIEVLQKFCPHAVKIAPPKLAVLRTAAAPLPPAPRSIPVMPMGSPQDELQRKLNIAQELLSRIFENLKASDLIRVVDDDDVPRVLLEVARGVLQSRGK